MYKCLISLLLITEILCIAPVFADDQEKNNESKEVLVLTPVSSRTFTLAELAKLPRGEVKDFNPIGVKKGPLGNFTWSGANLAEVLRAADPKIADPANASMTIVVTSVDGWSSTLFWGEVFGTPHGGAALYQVKGCSECHGTFAEGTDPKGKKAAPKLAGTSMELASFSAALREGGKLHNNLRKFPTGWITDDQIKILYDWLRGAETNANAYVISKQKCVVLLADQRDGAPLTGKEGLLQLIIGFDEFAGRFSHWVSKVEVHQP